MLFRSVLDVDTVSEAPKTDDEARVRERVMALSASMKAVTDPLTILGVAPDATERDLTAAYDEKMRLLDTSQLPEGPMRTSLESYADDVRKILAAARVQLLKNSGDDRS